MSARGGTSRLVLFAYPKSFRREYGNEVLQSIADLRRHGGLGRPRRAARLVVDVVRTAPRMRMESVMSHARFKPFALAAVLAICVISVAVGSPSFLVSIAAALVALVMLARNGGRPIATDPAQTSKWYRWVVAGALSFAIGFGVLIVDGNELTSTGWSVWMLSWGTGTVLVLFGLILLLGRVTRSGRVGRPTT